MRLLLVIESLGAGGAERQLSGLAAMLAARGHEVSLWYYTPKDFYRQGLEDSGVSVRYIPEVGPKCRRLFRLRSLIRAYRPDTVISYSQAASIRLCLLRKAGMGFRLITSERNTTQKLGPTRLLKFHLYRFADAVVPNSFSEGRFIASRFPFLKDRIHVITNFTDLDRFAFSDHSRADVPNITVVATIWASKNTLGFIDAVGTLVREGIQLRVKWYGATPDCQDYLDLCKAKIAGLGLGDVVELLPRTKEIAQVYRDCDFFCLPSFHEGTPNALCEALATGRPVICSDICDNRRYVSEGENGFLFDPKDAGSIAGAVRKALNLRDGEYAAACRSSRSRAESLCAEAPFINAYLELI